MALLHVKNVSHKFDYPLFNNIHIQLEQEQSMSIVGVSGCGKSTLLHICSTLLKPHAGNVYYNSQDIYALKNKELLTLRREKVGIIFQSHYLFKGFNAKENIELASILTNKKLDKSLLERLNILHVMKQNIGELSGGQQQRISIARILSKNPKIIFADEPTGNLDTNTAQEVMNILFEYIAKTGAALMLVTHDNTLAKKCDIAYELKDLNLTSL